MTADRRLLAGAMAALALLVAVAWIAYRDTRQLVDSQRGIAHAHDVLDAIQGVVGSLQDDEAAVHRHLVAGDEDLARRRELVRPDLETRLEELARLVSGAPEQRDRLAAFDGAIRAKLAYSEDVIQRRRTRGLGSAELASRLAESLRRSDEIRALAAHLQHTERRQLAAHTAAAQAATHRSLITLATAILLGLTLLAAVLTILLRERMKRSDADERPLELALDENSLDGRERSDPPTPRARGTPAPFSATCAGLRG